MSFNKFKQRYNVNLNEQQEAAVQAVEGAVLLLAVPGSGKTTVLINRLGYMIFDQGIAPENILTVTYTVAATKDMRSRFESRFGNDYAGRLEFRTINSLSQKILYFYGNMTGKKAYQLIENKAKAAVLKNIFRSINNAFATENDIKNIETAITYVKNMRFSDEEIDKFDAEVDNFADIYRMYQSQLNESGLIDFDDQMVYALVILEKIPGVLEHFQNQYRYICVDEAQDTSKLQHDMIHLLASKSGNLFMVGDEDQSIYGFRAAYPEALVSFEKVHKGAKILLMESNYRSNEEIVVSADKLIQSNKKRHEKHMKATRPSGGRVTRIEAQSRKAQISYLIKIADACQEETAVLYRNNESALPLIDMLERRHIKYRMKSNEMAFFTHPIVTDISDFIRLALNAFDTDAFLRIYYKMGAGISKATANYVVDHNTGNTPIMDAIDDLEDISAYTRKQCRALSTHFKNMRQESVGKAVYRILHYMSYLDYMSDHGMDPGKAEIMQLLANQEDNLEAFLPRLMELKDMIADGIGDYSSKFILSTIHSSKGLEYDTVYMLDMLEGTLPSIPEPKGKNVDPVDVSLYEEERRLFYVGMTRAKNALYIFTFKDAETSAFSKCVFEIKPKSTTRAVPSSMLTKNSGQLKSNHALLYMRNEPKKIFDKEFLKKLEDFEQGVMVHHNKYGDGAIVERENNIAEIYFENINGAKKIALDWAVEKGILQVR